MRAGEIRVVYFQALPRRFCRAIRIKRVIGDARDLRRDDDLDRALRLCLAQLGEDFAGESRQIDVSRPQCDVFNRRESEQVVDRGSSSARWPA